MNTTLKLLCLFHIYFSFLTSNIKRSYKITAYNLMLERLEEEFEEKFNFPSTSEFP